MAGTPHSGRSGYVGTSDRASPARTVDKQVTASQIMLQTIPEILILLTEIFHTPVRLSCALCGRAIRVNGLILRLPCSSANPDQTSFSSCLLVLGVHIKV